MDSAHDDDSGVILVAVGRRYSVRGCAVVFHALGLELMYGGGSLSDVEREWWRFLRIPLPLGVGQQ